MDNETDNQGKIPLDSYDGKDFGNAEPTGAYAESNTVRVKKMPRPGEPDYSGNPTVIPSENIENNTSLEASSTQMFNEPGMPDRKILKISCHNCMQKLDVTYLEPFSHFNCPSCNAELIVPKWFDAYLLEEAGGTGGMATVYRALDIALDREVAIKVLKPELASESERSELFLHEARTAATINHYAVVPIYTCGVYEGLTYIIMQYMGGGSLESALKLSRGPLPIRDVIRWMHDIAEGLENARAHGIVHHDVKPGNIMLDNDRNAKIGDFGIAQIISDAPSDKVQEMTSSWVSPHYVSPEKARSGKEDYRGDIYSLGATFYHLSTGFTPFSADDMEELIRMRLTNDPMPPNLHNHAIPPEIARLIMAMMDRNPENRPSYKDIIRLLADSLKEDPSTGAGGNARLRKISPSSSVSSSEKAGKSVAKKPLVIQKETLDKARRPPVRKSSGKGGLLTLLILLVILGGISWFAWKEGVLSRYVKFIPPPVPPVQFEADLMPEVSLAFAMGNPMAVIEFATPVLESVVEPNRKRIQAGLELLFAAYMLNRSDTEKICTNIAEQLDSIPFNQTDVFAGESARKSSPPYRIAEFLASDEIDAETLRKRLKSVSPEYATAGRFAEFLRALRKKEEPETTASLFTEFQTALEELPSDSWMRISWEKRLPYWKQTVKTRTGKKSEIEPLLATMIEKDGKWSFAKINTSKIFEDFDMPGNLKVDFSDDTASTSSSGEKTVSGEEKTSVSAKDLVITEEAVTNVAAALGVQRPHPLSPAAITPDEMRKYLDGISADKRKFESARARIVLQSKDFIVTMMLKMPYEADSFSSVSAGELGAGTVMANPNYLSFKDKKGKRTRVDWKQLPVEEFMRIIFYYAKIRENAISDETMQTDENKKVLAWDYLRLAVLSAWYSNNADAAEAAKKAISVYPKIASSVEKLMLK